MNLVYCDFTLACRKAHEMALECDSDVYIIEHHYDGGIEFTLETRPSESAAYIAEIGFTHKFKTGKRGKGKAFDYAKKFEKELNRTIFVKEVFKEINGYRFKDGFILTTTEPMDLYE